MSKENSLNLLPVPVDHEASKAATNPIVMSNSPGGSFFGDFNLLKGVDQAFQGAVQAVQGAGQAAQEFGQAVQGAGQAAQEVAQNFIDDREKEVIRSKQREEQIKMKEILDNLKKQPQPEQQEPLKKENLTRISSTGSVRSNGSSPSEVSSTGSSPSTKSVSSTASLVDVLKRLIRGNKDKNQSAPLQKPPIDSIDNSDVEKKHKKTSASCFSFLSNGAHNLFEYFSKSKDVNKTKTTPVEKKATQHERRESKQEKPSPVKKGASLFSSVRRGFSAMLGHEIPYDNLEVGVKNGNASAKLTEGGSVTLGGLQTDAAWSLGKKFRKLVGGAQVVASVTAGGATTLGGGVGEVASTSARVVGWAASSSPEDSYTFSDIREAFSSKGNTGASSFFSGYGPGAALKGVGGYLASTNASEFVPGERAAQASKHVAQALVNGGVGARKGVVKVGNRVGAAGAWASKAAEKATNFRFNVPVPGDWRGR